MAHYLIFIPKCSGIDPAPHLNKVGLGDLLREGEPGPSVLEIDNGPGGYRGVLMTWKNGDQHDAKLMIHDKLDWRPAVAIDHPEHGQLDADRYYIGIDTENPVQPADLIRRNPIRGMEIELNDGYRWSVPTISRLPNKYQLVDGGEISRVVKKEYARFFEIGMKIVGDIMDHFDMIAKTHRGDSHKDASIEITAKDGLRLIAAAIGLNYRVNWEIVFLLDLLDERSGAIALMAFCELLEIKESIDAKKKLPPLSIPVGSVFSNGKMA